MSELRLSNWGRWGADDERGTLNLITPEVIQRAAGLCRTGKVYSLAAPLETRGPQWPLRHRLWKATQFRNNPTGTSGCDDALMMPSHSGTHMDALCHIWDGNQLYNGFDAAQHVTSYGVTRDSIDKVGCIVGRGVLLDIATWKRVDHLELGEAINTSDLEECSRAQGSAIEPGDILLVRTGWLRVFSSNRELFDRGEPGLDASTLPWLKDHDVVAVGADNHGIEVMHQIPPGELPFHLVALRDLGIYLLEALNLEELSADKVYEFMLVIAPLCLVGGAGSPINPIAIS